MIKNTAGQTAFLRGLKLGEPTVWYCKSSNVDPEMRSFTAIICTSKMGIKIKQRKALLVLDDTIPQSVIIVEKIAE